MTIHTPKNTQIYADKIQKDVEFHLSLMIPVIEYISNFYIDNVNIFKRKLKRNHNIINDFITPLLNQSIEHNGEDNVYKYVDYQNEMIDNMAGIKDQKSFNKDLRACIKRVGLEIGKGVIDSDYNNHSIHPLARYYDCLVYLISQYTEIEYIKNENSALKITAYSKPFHKALVDQCELIAKKIKYVGNPYIVNSLLYYIIAKSHLREKSTVFDNEIEMIIKKNS